MRTPAPVAFASGFAQEVHLGLTRPGQKTLPCRYLYDEVGTLLFQTISALPEYGLTRADDRIIRGHAAEIAGLMAGATVVELGSGSGAKTKRILEAFARRSWPRYVPIDVSGSALAVCARDLGEVAEVAPIEGSYLEGLNRVASGRGPGERLLVLFLGSSIGNFNRKEAEAFLLDIRARLQPGDALLLGTDLEKPIERMLLAYDDPTLVTAAFNLNLLARINRELDGDFVLRRFAHEARYDARERRIEMHLRSLAAQRIRVRGAGVVLEMEKGETIWTESSYKFRPREVSEMAQRSGFTCARQWIDDEWPFAESLLFPAASI